MLWTSAAWAAAPSLSQQDWYFHPLSGFVLLWWFTAAFTFPRHRDAWAVLGVAIAARAAVYEPRIFMHEDKAYAALSMARGNEASHPLYGDGYAAWMGTLWPWIGGPGDHVHLFDAAISAWMAPFAWLAAWRATSDRGAALAAGLLAALLPWSVWIAPTETPYVLISTLQVAAVAASLGAGRADALLAALSAGLLAHMRPTQMVIAAIIALALAARRRWPAAAAVVALTGWRAAELIGHLQTGAASTRAAQVDALWVWQQPWTWAGHGGRISLLDPWVTPTALLPLAGFAALSPGARALRLPAVIVLANLLLYVHQPAGNDQLRFQLPAACMLAVLAGCGLAAAGQRWGRRALVGGVLALVASTAIAAHPLEPWPVWVVQHRFLVDHLRDVPRGRTVRFCDAGDTNHLFYHWINRRSEGFWKPVEGDERTGELRFVGWADLLPGAPPVPWGRLDPVAEVVADPVWSGLMNLSDAPVRIGLYRVTAAP